MADDSFTRYVLDQLAALDGVAARRLFSGRGLYWRGLIFGLVDDGRLYFKVSPETRPRYAAEGSSPFEPWPGHVMNGYWEVPASVLEDADLLAAWARQAWAIPRKPSRASRRARPGKRHERDPRAGGFTLVEVLIVVAVVLVLASIAIVSSRHSRIAANEAAAIQELRDAVANQNGNPAEIIGAPINCGALPGEFLGTKSGYVRGCSGGVYWARPQVPGRTGDRGFAIEGSGRICVSADGTVPTMAAGCVGLR